MIEINNMDEIIENLWLGNYCASINIPNLKNKGIKKILTVMDHFEGPNYDIKDFNHKIFDIEDKNRQNIIQYFGDCLNFIKGEEKILVHCIAGSSRSASIVIAYLMWIKKWKLEQTLKFVKEKRPIVGPIEGFLKQLEIFEKLLIENDYDIEKINFKDIKWEPASEMININ